MIKPLRNSIGVLAGLAALALGGSAIAGAASSSTPTKAATPSAQEVTTGPDTDNVQSGDQTTPDATKASASEVTTGPDTDNVQNNVQSGDQTTPDTAGASQADTSTSEKSSETSGESAAKSDGPGGYQGNSNADGQQQGQN